MKLVIAVVQGSDAERLVAALVERGFRATQINSSGGFLREQNVTLMVGVEDGQVPAVREIVRQNCHARTRFVNPLMPIVEPGEFYAPSPIEVLVGGATIFVLDIVRYERIGVPAAID
ncbi:MAG: cyclic-di-AMP receptor [Thermomicrobiales bacterium]